ncbi:phosphatidylglycerophosphatase A [bacterium]|nr:MAG: phosphatidylglycerophosphatase A [bacterium]
MSHSIRGFIILKNLSRFIATVGYTGYIPYAPGTFGSAVGFVFVILIKPEDSVLLVILIAVFFLGVITSGNAEKFLGKDSGHIVIDEFCGYLLAVLFVPRNMGYLIAAFILFRIFDIIKPPPLKNIEEKASGGIGIMLDDVMAALYANLCVQVWRLVIH